MSWQERQMLSDGRKPKGMEIMPTTFKVENSLQNSERCHKRSAFLE
jgi:hypothetical protein